MLPLANLTIYQVNLESKQEIAFQTNSFIFSKPSDFNYQAGQFVNICLTGLDKKDQKRAMSLASSPNDNYLMIAMRMTNSAFKAKIDSLPLGSQIAIEGPLGEDLIIDKNDKRPLVFIAGGIGITPFLSIIRDQKHKNFPRRITLFYSNRRPEDTTFKKELESIQHNNFQLICTITNLAESKKKWTKETGRISAGLIKKYITDIKEPVYYIVGLLEMVADMRKMLIDLEVGEEQIKIESFGGYPVRKPAGQ